MSASTSAATLAAAADLAAGLQAVTEAVRAACADPADAIVLLLQLAAYQPEPIMPGQDAIGIAVTQAAAATAASCRRAALASLALAAASYNPFSYQDAVRVRGLVCAAIDAEIANAGALPDYDVYVALRALRAAVVTDLNARAASLASVVTVTRPMPQPCLAVAYDLYDDASRYDRLVREVNPVSPLFMPRQFQALAR